MSSSCNGFTIAALLGVPVFMARAQRLMAIANVTGYDSKYYNTLIYCYFLIDPSLSPLGKGWAGKSCEDKLWE